MGFRLKAFAAHAASSACALALILSALYLGWYRWPGWYVTNFVHVMTILLSVDVTMGPLFTLLVANPQKPRRVLARDIAVIVTLQLAALVYGVSTLWSGRPLYYAYSTRELEAVAASQIPTKEVELARHQNPQFAPHWYSLPSWVFAAVPTDAAARKRTMEEAKVLGVDVTQMPRYFEPLQRAGDVLRAQLQKVDDIFIFTRAEKRLLKDRMAQRGLPTDQANCLYMIGRDRPVLVVFDPTTLNLLTLVRAN